MTRSEGDSSEIEVQSNDIRRIIGRCGKVLHHFVTLHVSWHILHIYIYIHITSLQ
jgi:predicted RNA-binding protein YlqC (UPF0109 family)